MRRRKTEREHLLLLLLLLRLGSLAELIPRRLFGDDFFCSLALCSFVLYVMMRSIARFEIYFKWIRQSSRGILSSLFLARSSWWQRMQISRCQCVDTYGGSTDHIYTVSYCPQLWCNTHFSLRLFSSLLSTNIYFIHQVKQELTCDIDSYGVHGADLYSLTDDDEPRLRHGWSLGWPPFEQNANRTVLTNAIWLIQSLSKHSVDGIFFAEALSLFLLVEDNDDQMTLLLRLDSPTSDDEKDYIHARTHEQTNMRFA